MNLNKIIFYLGIFSFIIITSCKEKNSEINIPVPTQTYDAEAATKWAEMTLRVVKRANLNTPTYCARSLGYIGLGMYESISPANQKESVSSSLNGLQNMPVYNKANKFKPELALNAAEAFLIKKYYGYADPLKNASVDSLEAALKTKYSQNESQAVIDNSIQFGLDIATAIYNWSTTDGGHEGYKKNFDPSYTMPNVQGKWGPAVGNSQSPSLIPLHPHWGSNRRFALKNNSLTLPVATTYSEDPTSLYYQQFNELIVYSANLTQLEKETALWWGDDPKDSYSPGGHSYNLGLIAAKQTQADLFLTAETFARVGMALSDAFVNCWDVKYIYVRERPSAFALRHVDANWKSWWPEPPFPSFISGHATQGMAAAVVLEDLYGINFTFIDNTNAGRPKDLDRNVDFKNRTFTSFRAMANECAMSRFYGGIHIKDDNEKGALVGEMVANNINEIFK